MLPASLGGSRSPSYAVFLVATCPVPDMLGEERLWVRSLWDALSPYTPGVGGYVNSMAEVEQDRLMATYGPAKYERLRRIKAAYDPRNLFHRNPNIPPA